MPGIPLIGVVEISQIRDLRDVLHGDFDAGAASSVSLYGAHMSGVDLWVKDNTPLYYWVVSRRPEFTVSTAQPVNGFTHFALSTVNTFQELLDFIQKNMPEYQVFNAGTSAMYT